MNQSNSDYVGLLAAWHNIDGDVLEILVDSDDAHGELLPGEEILLIFQGAIYNDRKVDFVIVVEGRYISL